MGKVKNHYHDEICNAATEREGITQKECEPDRAGEHRTNWTPLRESVAKRMKLMVKWAKVTIKNS